LILIDSTLYIQWLRNRDEFTLELEHWIRSQQLYICGIIRVEVIRGISNPAQRDRMEEFFDLIPDIPTDSQVWKEASDLAWQLDRKGLVLPVSDLIIGVSALRIGATVFTLDKHFQKIPELKCRKSLPRI